LAIPEASQSTAWSYEALNSIVEQLGLNTLLDNTVEYLGLNTLYGPISLVFISYVLSVWWGVPLLKRSASASGSAAAFALAVSAVGQHFTFTIGEQYSLVGGIYLGVIFLTDPEKAPKGAG
jgi:hypothetical protein